MDFDNLKRPHIGQIRTSNLYPGLCIVKDSILSIGDMDHCMNITDSKACASLRHLTDKVFVWFCAKNAEILDDIIGDRRYVSCTGNIYHSPYLEVFPNIPKSFNDKVITEFLFEIS